VRTYYDHEAGYRVIAERGGTGWDDCPSVAALPGESYAAIDELLASNRVPAGDAIDLGCGGGQASIRLANHGFTVTGVDFAPTAIELASANVRAAGVTVRLLEGDCLDLAFADGSFDLALDNHVLHCLIGADRARFLREAARLLRPGGWLFSDSMSREGDFDPPKLGCDPITYVSQRGNRYWVSEAELIAELADFDIVWMRRVTKEPGIGDGLTALARRR
jgi:SAM-dependent methyltransferase